MTKKKKGQSGKKHKEKKDEKKGAMKNKQQGGSEGNTKNKEKTMAGSEEGPIQHGTMSMPKGKKLEKKGSKVGKQTGGSEANQEGLDQLSREWNKKVLIPWGEEDEDSSMYNTPDEKMLSTIFQKGMSKSAPSSPMGSERNRFVLPSMLLSDNMDDNLETYANTPKYESQPSSPQKKRRGRSRVHFAPDIPQFIPRGSTDENISFKRFQPSGSTTTSSTEDAPVMFNPPDVTYSQVLQDFPSKRKEKKKREDTATGVVLPLTGKPYEMDLPVKKVGSKKDLEAFLIKSGVFRVDTDDSDDDIELGLYWKSIQSDFRTKPRPSIIFRFSKGTPLPKNDLCQKWRADPWKKTYGPIVLLRIQDSESCFRVASYLIHEYERECRTGSDTASPGPSTPSKHFGRVFTNVKKGRVSASAPASPTRFMQSPMSIPTLSDSSSQKEVGGGSLNMAPTFYSPKQNIFRNVPPNNPASNAFKMPLNRIHVKYPHIEETLMKLRNMVVVERWNFVQSSSKHSCPVLSNYVEIRINVAHNLGAFVLITSGIENPAMPKIIYDLGLKDRKTNATVYGVFHQVSIQPIEIQFVEFGFWTPLAKKYSVSLQQMPPSGSLFEIFPHSFCPYSAVELTDFVHPGTDRIDVDFFEIYKISPSSFPRRWQVLTPFEKKLLCKSCDLMLKRLFNGQTVPFIPIVQLSADSLFLRFCLPFGLFSFNIPEFAVVLQYSVESNLFKCVDIISLDAAYTCARCIKPLDPSTWISNGSTLPFKFSHFVLASDSFHFTPSSVSHFVTEFLLFASSEGFSPPRGVLVAYSRIVDHSLYLTFKGNDGSAFLEFVLPPESFSVLLTLLRKFSNLVVTGQIPVFQESTSLCSSLSQISLSDGFSTTLLPPGGLFSDHRHVLKYSSFSSSSSSSSDDVVPSADSDSDDNNGNDGTKNSLMSSSSRFSTSSPSFFPPPFLPPPSHSIPGSTLPPLSSSTFDTH